jgi:hypothetical protein
MVQLTPQSRIFLAIQPVDFRNYAESVVMPSSSHSSHAQVPYQGHVYVQKAAADCA